MAHTTDGHASAPARNSLPEPPGPPNTWWDRESRLRDQANALDALIREDLSRGRTLAFLLCSGVVTLVAALVPVMVVDAADSESSEATAAPVAAVLGIAMLAVIAVPALLVLRKLRQRSVQRYESLRQWAAVDRGHDAEFPMRSIRYFVSAKAEAVCCSVNYAWRIESRGVDLVLRTISDNVGWVTANIDEFDDFARSL